MSVDLASGRSRSRWIFGLLILGLLLGWLVLRLAIDGLGGRPVIPKVFPAITDRNSLKITLQRGPCYGLCPIYSVSVDGQGNVVWDGYVQPGHYLGWHDHQTFRTHVSLQTVSNLLAAFQKARFFWLFDRYAFPATDLSETRIAIAFNGHKKQVIDYSGRKAGMPKDVTDLEIMIDQLAETGKHLAVKNIAAELPEPPQFLPIQPKAVSIKPPKFLISKSEEAH